MFNQPRSKEEGKARNASNNTVVLNEQDAPLEEVTDIVKESRDYLIKLGF